MVGTVKKSTEARFVRLFVTKAFQVCEGGLFRRNMYLATLV